MNHPAREALGASWFVRGATWATLSFLALLILGQAFSVPVGHYDQGFALTNGWRLWQGEMPHKDYWTVYPPGSAVVLALAFELAQPSVWVSRVVHTLWGLVLLFSFWYLVKPRATRAASLVATACIVFWYCDGMYPGYSAATGLALTVVSVALLGAALESRQTGLAVFSGIVGGIVTMFRHDFAAYLMFAVATVWIVLRFHGDKPAGRPLTSLLGMHLAASAVTAASLMATLFGFAGAYNVWEQMVVVPATVLRANRQLPVPAFFADAWPPSWLWLLAWIVPLALVCLLVPLWQQRRHLPIARWTIALVCWSTSALMTLQGFSRLDISHVVPGAALLAATMAATGWPSSKQSVSRWVRLGNMVLAAVLIAFTALGATRNKELQQYAQCLAAPASPACMSVSTDSLQVVKRVKAMTLPHEFVFVGNSRHDRIFVNDALMYFLLQRPIPVPWNEMHPGIVNTAPVQAAIVEMLERRKVRVVVLADMPMSSEPNLSSRSSGVVLLDEYLRSTFREVASIGNYRILER